MGHDNIFTVVAAVIIALPAFLAWLNTRKLPTKVEKVHELVNGQAEQLRKVAEAAALAQGKLKGQEDERRRQEAKGQTEQC